MISLTSIPQNELKRALDRVLSYNPTITKLSPSRYQVQSQSNPSSSGYEVTVTGTNFTCTCPAHTIPPTAAKPAPPMLCKHIAAVALFIAMENEGNNADLCQKCGVGLVYKSGLCYYCFTTSQPAPPSSPEPAKTLVFDQRLVSTERNEAWYRRYKDDSECINIWNWGDPVEGINYSLEEAEYFVLPGLISSAKEAYEEWKWKQELDATITQAEASEPTTTGKFALSADEYMDYVDEMLSD